MSGDEFRLPKGDELNQSGEFEDAPLAAEDYIVKIAKIALQRKPKWNNNAYDYSQMQLRYDLVLLPYKLKAEDGMKDIKGRDRKPLKGWIFKEVNPFSLGVNAQGVPSNLRALLAFSQGLTDASANAEISIPGIIVLDKDDNFASQEDTDAYKKQFKALLNNEIMPAQFEMRNNGYKHIPDIRSYEGNYISVKLGINARGANVIEGRSRVPSSFTPDATIEKEAMDKFEESYAKMLKKKEEKKNAAVIQSQTSTADVISIPSDDLPF